MADLAAELLRRNARLRAWRAYGLPVEGGWRLGLGDLGPYGELTLGCATCGQSGMCGVGDRVDLIVPFERDKAGDLCPHLAPLLGADPPEVEGILELEILAGDPPRG